MEATLSTPTTPFTNPSLVHGPLYATPERLTQRTSALHRAKTGGADAAATIAALAAAANPAPNRVADVGCGRGTTTIQLSRQYPTATVIATDRSASLLAAAGNRLRAHGHPAVLVVADFHQLPFAGLDIVVAAFCLYHSPQPRRVLAEIARCLNPGGYTILATKSADSYHSVDTAIAASGLGDATSRPNLYQSFHTGNAADHVAAAGLHLVRRVDHGHTFEFSGLNHLAEYAVTNPKYQLPDELTAEPTLLAAELRRRLPDTPVTARSTVTYLVAQRR